MPIIDSTINSIENREIMTDALDRALVQESKTAFMLDNDFGAKFIDNETVKIPSAQFTGLTDYDRDKGFAVGASSIKYVPYTIAMDRGRRHQVDRRDAKTTTTEMVGSFFKDYISEYVAPEKDAYTISKLYSIANEKGGVGAAKSVADLTDAIHGILVQERNRVNAANKFRSEENICFLHPDAYDQLTITKELQRSLAVAELKVGSGAQVHSVDVEKIGNTLIVPMDEQRMKTAYEFSASTEASEGGFAAADGAGTIAMLIVPRKAASQVQLTPTMRVWTPNTFQDADSYAWDYRVLYDCFVKASRAGTIRAFTFA